MAEEGDTLTVKGFAKPVRTYTAIPSPVSIGTGDAAAAVASTLRRGGPRRALCGSQGDTGR